MRFDLRAVVRSFAGTLCLLCLSSVGWAQSYPKDANGWSVLTPSADSRLIYVSASGNDATARAYAPSAVGNDPRNPTGTIAAYKTLGAARGQQRQGFPDWILIRRGETFTEAITFGGGDDGGRSGSERHVYTYYGASGNRPLLTAARWSYVGVAAHVAIVGLEVYYRQRDPASSFFVGFGTLAHEIIYVVLNRSAGNFLVEDCVLRHGRDDMTISSVAGLIPNVDVRRNAIWDGHNGTGADALADRAQGLYAASIQNLLVEDNFFDRNGWTQDAAGNLAGNGRSRYSHNVYLANGSSNTTVSGNIISRAGSNGLQARAGNIVDDNLFVLNPIGLFSQSTPSDANEGLVNDVTGNVLIAGDDIAPSRWSGDDMGVRGWGIEVHRTPEGLYEDNIILDEASAASNPWAINGRNGTGSKPILIWGNIVRSWGSGIVVEAPAQYDLRDNIVNGVNQTTGQRVTFVDPSRTLSTYLTSIGASGNNITFINNARAAWLGAPRTFAANYRASTVNAYFRAGFTVTGSAAPRTVTIAATDAAAAEPSNGGQFRVTVSPAPTGNLAINLTRSGTATNGADYASIPSTVTVGTSGTATINVTVTNDATVEGNETVLLGLAAGTGYTVGSPGSATVTIADDDTAPALVLANAGFETPATTTYVYNPSGASWTFTGNSGVQRNGSGWRGSNAPQGVQTAFLQGNRNQGPALGSITQTVRFAAARAYTITLQAARRGGQVQPLRLRVDGVQVGALLTPAGNAFAPLTSASFTVNVGNHTIALEATDNAGDKSTLVDAIQIN